MNTDHFGFYDYYYLNELKNIYKISAHDLYAIGGPEKIADKVLFCAKVYPSMQMSRIQFIIEARGMDAKPTDLKFYCKQWGIDDAGIKEYAEKLFIDFDYNGSYIIAKMKTNPLPVIGVGFTHLSAVAVAFKLLRDLKNYN